MKTTKTLKAYVQAVKWSWADDFQIMVAPDFWDNDDTKSVKQLGQVDIDFEIDESEIDFRSVEIENLTAQKVKLLADTEVKAKSIEERIQSLQALESN